MRYSKRATLLVLIAMIVSLMQPVALSLLAADQTPAQPGSGPLLKAVLFYSPTCPHCHKVIKEILPPLLNQYAGRLSIVAVNTAGKGGQELFQNAIRHFQLPKERQGVPILVAGTTVLVGPEEIAVNISPLLDYYAARGGMGLPDIPGMEEEFAKATAKQSSAPPARNPNEEDGAPAREAGHPAAKEPAAASAPAVIPGIDARTAQPETLVSRFERDPLGNSIAVAMLAVVLFTIFRVSYGLWRGKVRRRPTRLLQWGAPALSLIGLGVSAYLAYVGSRHAPMLCGPIGDCDLVQKSSYARLFGLVHVSYLGMAGYLAILATWGLKVFGPERSVGAAERGLFVLSFAGTLFSAYLTFLEPFVIGAVCSWCLVSAAAITALLWLSHQPVKSVEAGRSPASIPLAPKSR